MALPLGWFTDLAVLRIGGSLIEEHADHVVVRTPQNPTYHWGHFLLVTDDTAVDDADRWLSLFTATFPGAEHRAVGLITAPADESGWVAAGLEVEHDEVLVAHDPVASRPLAAGYRVRPLADPGDWERSNALREQSYPGSPEFTRGTTEARSAMTERGQITWLGAFTASGELAAELGIVDCGDGVARYQSVLTHPDHRRQGLTGHLLGVADARARAAGARTSVIIADGGSDAARLYRAVGLLDDSAKAQAYRFSVGSLS